MAKAKDRSRDEKNEKKDAKKDEPRAKKSKSGFDAEGRRKAKKPKPKGMRWVNPSLRVRDVTAALAWYEKAFGFKTSFTLPGPDGKPIHAEMLHRKSVIMVGPEEASARAPGKDGTPVSLYCYCGDVDALCASARAAGAKIVMEPEDQFWGDRTCFLVDPEGHQWTFATHVFDLDPESLPCEEPACSAAAKEAEKKAPPGSSTPTAPSSGDGGTHATSTGLETALGKMPAKT